MARSFSVATTTSLQYSGAILSSTPISMAAWFYHDSGGAGGRILTINDSGTAANLFSMLGS